MILIEDDTPCTEWIRARIHKLHPGSDGVIRTVTLKTATGFFKRPTTKLAFLPIEERIIEFELFCLYVIIYMYFTLFLYLYTLKEKQTPNPDIFRCLNQLSKNV